DTTVANDDSSIPSISSSLVMNLSPNPITKSAQYLNVDLKGSALNKGDQITLEIFNIKGQSILNETYQAQTGPRTLQISTSSFSNGVHICRVTSGQNKTISKFTVIK
ncbi:MAG: T9SS type A sorting domain-containing protein, partial [Syntrophomonadaceae bacterium]|nr:T9SS type A sorting domain-containing protein [Syntrophomonadaceae bacterium]